MSLSTLWLLRLTYDLAAIYKRSDLSMTLKFQNDESKITAVYLKISEFQNRIICRIYTRYIAFFFAWGIVVFFSLIWYFVVAYLGDRFGAIQSNDLFGVICLGDWLGVTYLDDLFGVIYLGDRFGVICLDNLFGMICLFYDSPYDLFKMIQIFIYIFELIIYYQKNFHFYQFLFF